MRRAASFSSAARNIGSQRRDRSVGAAPCPGGRNPDDRRSRLRQPGLAAMQSIYWMLTWASHRECPHCGREGLPRTRACRIGSGDRTRRIALSMLPEDTDAARQADRRAADRHSRRSARRLCGHGARSRRSRRHGRTDRAGPRDVPCGSIRSGGRSPLRALAATPISARLRAMCCGSAVKRDWRRAGKRFSGRADNGHPAACEGPSPSGFRR